MHGIKCIQLFLQDRNIDTLMEAQTELALALHEAESNRRNRRDLTQQSREKIMCEELQCD